MGAIYLVEHVGQALQVETFARRFYTFFNGRQLDEAESMVDQQALFSYPAAPEHMVGRAGYRELARRWLEAFPDSQLSMTAVHVRGNTALTEMEAEGTHSGVLDLPGLAPIPPTGRVARLAIRETIGLQSGLIVTVRTEFDPAELRRVLGV